MNGIQVPSGASEKNSSLSARKCPSCGAPLGLQDVACAYCGSQALPVALSESQRQELRALARDLNTRLEAQRQALYRRFRFILLSCTLIFILSGLLLRVIFLVSLAWVMPLVIACTALVFIIIRRLYQARLASSAIRLYLHDLEPQLEAFTCERSIPRWQFDTLAAASLDKGAPLRFFLAGRTPPRKTR